jgi:hypothetical protein
MREQLAAIPLSVRQERVFGAAAVKFMGEDRHIAEPSQYG